MVNSRPNLHPPAVLARRVKLDSILTTSDVKVSHHLMSTRRNLLRWDRLRLVHWSTGRGSYVWQGVGMLGPRTRSRTIRSVANCCGPRLDLLRRRSSRRAGAGWPECRGAPARGPAAYRQERGVLVAGPTGSPACAVQYARLARVARVSGCSGPRSARVPPAGWRAERRPGFRPRRSRPGREFHPHGQCRGDPDPGRAHIGGGEWRTIAGRGRIPGVADEIGEIWRTVRVSGCSGPNTRSKRAQRGHSSRAAAASPACPVQ